MELNKNPMQVKRMRRFIIGASVAIPVVVALLFGAPKVEGITWFKNLPVVYASINALTAVLLVAALVMIKKKNIKRHQQLINTCMLLSLLFLLCYIAYHLTNENTLYRNTGGILYFYYFILISHILLSVAVIPLVLFSYFYAWQGNFVRHRKWTKWTWPIWFYVAISGVAVYLMISPFYK